MESSPRVGRLLLLSGVLTIAVGVGLVVALGELWPLVIVAVGVSDLAIGTLLHSGLLGSRETKSSAVEADDGFGVDPSENPYARED